MNSSGRNDHKPAARPSGGNRIRRSRCVSDRAHSRAAGMHREAARGRHAEFEPSRARWLLRRVTRLRPRVPVYPIGCAPSRGTASDVLSIAVPAVIDVPGNAPLSPPRTAAYRVLSPPPFSHFACRRATSRIKWWPPSREGATHEAAPKDAGGRNAGSAITCRACCARDARDGASEGRGPQRPRVVQRRMAGCTIQATVAGRTGRARPDIEAAVRATFDPGKARRSARSNARWRSSSPA